MTNEALTRQRNFFLIGFFVLVGIGVVFRVTAMRAAPDRLELLLNLGTILTFVAKGIFIYLVFRLSRFLHQPIWLTIMYCVLTPFSVLYLVPFVGLLIGIKTARRKLQEKRRETS